MWPWAFGGNRSFPAVLAFISRAIIRSRFLRSSFTAPPESNLRNGGRGIGFKFYLSVEVGFYSILFLLSPISIFEEESYRTFFPLRKWQWASVSPSVSRFSGRNCAMEKLNGIAFCVKNIMDCSIKSPIIFIFFSFSEVERSGKIVTKSYKQGDSGELPIIPAETITEKSSRRRRSKGCRGTW